MNTRPKLLFVITEDWYFVSHRLPAGRGGAEGGPRRRCGHPRERMASEIEGFDDDDLLVSAFDVLLKPR